MSDYKSLELSEVKDISEDYYQSRSRKTEPQDNPTIVLVGAQPGAGKTNIAISMRNELSAQGGFIHVDADRMREKIYLGDSNPTSAQTQADAGKLVASLRSMAIDNKRNILEEGTFRNSESVDKFINDRHKDGYKVELAGVATSRVESVLGIYQRYELQHLPQDANPRFVPIKYHDEAMEGFDKTVATLSEKFDRVRIFQRSGDVLYDSQSNNNKYATPLEAIYEGRKVDDRRLKAISDSWERVEFLAEERKAPAAYKREIEGHKKDVADIIQSRLHEHSMKNVDKHLRVLVQDKRFDNQNDKDLLRAAYFRGMHEKSAEFKGEPTRFQVYDSAMAAKQLDLPHVVDLLDHKVDRNEGKSIPRSQDEPGHSL